MSTATTFLQFLLLLPVCREIRVHVFLIFVFVRLLDMYLCWGKFCNTACVNVYLSFQRLTIFWAEIPFVFMLSFLFCCWHLQTPQKLLSGLGWVRRSGPVWGTTMTTIKQPSQQISLNCPLWRSFFSAVKRRKTHTEKYN